MTRHDSSRVTPFGHLRITECVLLPVAFRSLPRPSSPSGPKASTMNPYSLDHMYRYSLYRERNTHNLYVFSTVLLP
jgi:hypothetical protein